MISLRIILVLLTVAVFPHYAAAQSEAKPRHAVLETCIPEDLQARLKTRHYDRSGPKLTKEDDSRVIKAIMCIVEKSEYALEAAGARQIELQSAAHKARGRALMGAEIGPQKVAVVGGKVSIMGMVLMLSQPRLVCLWTYTTTEAFRRFDGEFECVNDKNVKQEMSQEDRDEWLISFVRENYRSTLESLIVLYDRRYHP